MPSEAPEPFEQTIQAIEPLEAFQTLQSTESTWTESETAFGQVEFEIKFEILIAIIEEEIPVTSLEVIAAGRQAEPEAFQPARNILSAGT